MSIPEKLIGGHLFAVPPLDAMSSFTMQPRLAPVIAEVLALVFAALDVLREKGEEDAGKPEGEEAKPKPMLDLENLTVEQFLELDLDLGAHAETIVGAISRICAKLPPKELRAITRELLAQATMNGVRLFTEQGDPFNQLLKGQTVLIWRLLFFAVQANYPDVFSRRAASGAATQAAESRSAESTT